MSLRTSDSLVPVSKFSPKPRQQKDPQDSPVQPTAPFPRGTPPSSSQSQTLFTAPSNLPTMCSDTDVYTQSLPSVNFKGGSCTILYLIHQLLLHLSSPPPLNSPPFRSTQNFHVHTLSHVLVPTCDSVSPCPSENLPLKVQPPAQQSFRQGNGLNQTFL